MYTYLSNIPEFTAVDAFLTQYYWYVLLLYYGCFDVHCFHKFSKYIPYKKKIRKMFSLQGKIKYNCKLNPAEFKWCTTNTTMMWIPTMVLLNFELHYWQSFGVGCLLKNDLNHFSWFYGKVGHYTSALTELGDGQCLLLLKKGSISPLCIPSESGAVSLRAKLSFKWRIKENAFIGQAMVLMLFPWSTYFSYSLAPELRKKLKSSKNNFWQSLSHWQLYKDKLPKKLNAEIVGSLEIPILTDTRKSIMAKIWIFLKLGTKCMLTLNWTVAAPSF